MQANEKPEFLRVLNGLAAIKPNAKLTPEALDMWWAALSNWSLTDFKAAAAHLAKSEQFFPNPYHFEQLRKAGRSTAGEAWARAIGASSTCYHAGQFTRGGSSGDPLIDRVVRALGGYAAIAQCDEDKLHFLERRFVEHYESMQDADETRESLPEIAWQDAPKVSYDGLRSAADHMKRITDRSAS